MRVVIPLRQLEGGENRAAHHVAIVHPQRWVGVDGRGSRGRRDDHIEDAEKTLSGKRVTGGSTDEIARDDDLGRTGTSAPDRQRRDAETDRLALDGSTTDRKQLDAGVGGARSTLDREGDGGG